MRCNMWSRNGESMYRQAWFYVSSNFSDYGPDLDVHILQACGVETVGVEVGDNVWLRSCVAWCCLAAMWWG